MNERVEKSSNVNPKLNFRLLSLVFSTIGGFVLAGGGMNAAWQHNAQQEIYSEAGINWGYWLTIGTSWFVVGFFLFFIISIPVYKFLMLVIERHKRNENDL